MWAGADRTPLTRSNDDEKLGRVSHRLTNLYDLSLLELAERASLGVTFRSRKGGRGVLAGPHRDAGRTEGW